ncbi:MAG: CRISPR-associated helicase/endonuclease Cas3, partial [Clostridiales bacterium]|nr:CRISPR-associated helicase/endonuclease Cas3 [Clostridiales bacterium]
MIGIKTRLSIAARSIWAKKSNKNGDLFWLPLLTHMTDSALVARKLWSHWLSDGIRKVFTEGTNGTEADARKLFIFAAAIHDFGKATPVFQAKKAFPPSRELDEYIEGQIIASGLPIRPFSDFHNANKTPHALATQFLLLQAGCPDNIA